MSRQKAKKPAKSKAPPKLVAAKNGKPRNGKAGEPPKRAPTPLSTAKAQQYQDFERAIGLLNQRNYRDAKEMFEKAKLGPSLAMSAHAAESSGDPFNDSARHSRMFSPSANFLNPMSMS